MDLFWLELAQQISVASNYGVFVIQPNISAFGVKVILFLCLGPWLQSYLISQVRCRRLLVDYPAVIGLLPLIGFTLLNLYLALTLSIR